MFKKLKRRFILLSMVTLALLMITVVLGMNVINYYSVVNEVDNVVSMLSEIDEMSSESDVETDFDMLPPNMSPEVPYESRYFVVEINASGKSERIDVSRIAAVDEEQALEYADEALLGRNDRGFIDHFRFLKLSEDDGGMRIIFLDSGRRINYLGNFLVSSISMAILGYIIICIVAIFLAGKIIRPVAESYEKQKRFITDAGHEIKTPLSIINANVDLMEIEGCQSESLGEITKQTKRLTKLTEDLVFLAKMEEKETDMKKRDFSLSDMVEEMLLSFEVLAESKNKRFDTEIEPKVIIHGNNSGVCQMINVLLDNAIKYSPEQSAISVTLEKKGRMAFLSVANTVSSPIGKDDVVLIFERFYRTDSSRSSKTGGNGIGLSIAKAVVDAHGGKIYAELIGENYLQITAEIPIY